jgi:hypothetical protein
MNRISSVSDDDPRWQSPEASHGVDTGFEIGPAAPEASPPMRMTASWSGRYGPTEYKVVARYFAPDGKLPSDRFVVPLKITGAQDRNQR